MSGEKLPLHNYEETEQPVGTQDEAPAGSSDLEAPVAAANLPVDDTDLPVEEVLGKLGLLAGEAEITRNPSFQSS